MDHAVMILEHQAPEDASPIEALAKLMVMLNSPQLSWGFINPQSLHQGRSHSTWMISGLLLLVHFGWVDRQWRKHDLDNNKPKWL